MELGSPFRVTVLIPREVFQQNSYCLEFHGLEFSSPDFSYQFLVSRFLKGIEVF